MSSDSWRALTAFAVLAAVATSFAAVSLHALEVAAGWELARAQRRAERLDRRLREAEHAVATARSPSVLLATAQRLGLDVEYPERARFVLGEDVQYLREAADAERAVVVRADDR